MAWMSFLTHERGVLAASVLLAYLDPGTGSYLVQLILGGLLGLLFLVKAYWKKISLFVRKIFSRNKDTEISQE